MTLRHTQGTVYTAVNVFLNFYIFISLSKITLVPTCDVKTTTCKLIQKHEELARPTEGLFLSPLAVKKTCEATQVIHTLQRHKQQERTKTVP